MLPRARTRRLSYHRDLSCLPEAGNQLGVQVLLLPPVHGTRLHPLLLAPMLVLDPRTLTHLQRLPLPLVAAVVLVAR
jgi:hypothetical protein